jgi:hypothetical protein
VFLINFFQWLGETEWSVALQESLWVYPIIESIHVLTLCLFVGFAMVLDLRLLGVVMKYERVSDVAKRLLPWTVAGFVAMIVSGALLFYAIPLKTYLNIFFRVKLVLLILAGINAWVFHNTIYRRVTDWDTDPLPPKRARMAGALSLFFWACIIVAGRMIAYNWFDKMV